eukprot:CAMPEP_0168540042 /NCGR_PEP_ID=MMETSP0413-20121227/64_1 /TAXON_ID=136452 /ORGANISM="Filamoeba nolandi, Strain NC-AS-23-1" /LENGTH=162 /DNA_ID=CAMNT_0008569747 /DNA_START=113 /DNA_END=601 /DNA_ORIENTATION=-
MTAPKVSCKTVQAPKITRISTQRRTFADYPNLKVTFASPAVTILNQKPVQIITVPGLSGDFGIVANHVPTVSELRPGIVSYQTVDGKTENFFVSGGFAFVKESDCQVSVVEAVPLEDLDEHAAKENLKQATDELARAQTDEEKAVQQIAIEVNQAIIAALGK